MRLGVLWKSPDKQQRVTYSGKLHAMAVSIHHVQFNIIYIMRTLVVICGFCRPGLIHGLSPAANHAGAGYSCR